MAVRSGNEFTRPVVGAKPGGRLAFSRYWAFFASFALSALSWVGACNDDSAPRAWPAGTVVAIDRIPITSDEIARDMLGVMLLEPQSVDAQIKRLAFNEIALPRALLRARTAADARETERRSIDETFARIESGSQIGPLPASGVYGIEVKGGYGDLGLVVWGAAMNLAVGEWSEVLEEPGAFVRVRLLERKQAGVPAATILRVDRIEAFYTKPGAPKNLDLEMQHHRLTIVDPAWDKIVPERTKILMGVHDQ